MAIPTNSPPGDINVPAARTPLQRVIGSSGIIISYVIFAAGTIAALNVLSESSGWGWHIPHSIVDYIAVTAIRLSLNNYLMPWTRASVKSLP